VASGLASSWCDDERGWILSAGGVADAEVDPVPVERHRRGFRDTIGSGRLPGSTVARSLAGSRHCGWPPGARGLESRSGFLITLVWGVVPPHIPSQVTRSWAGSSSWTISSGAGRRPSAWSNQGRPFSHAPGRAESQRPLDAEVLHSFGPANDRYDTPRRSRGYVRERTVLVSGVLSDQLYQRLGRTINAGEASGCVCGHATAQPLAAVHGWVSSGEFATTVAWVLPGR
jgi:hypothetical protein